MQAALDAYYSTLSQFHTLDVRREQSVRRAMETLLTEAAREAHWTLVAEEPLPNGKRPDATFFDDYRIRRGYWEAKDTQDDLETEITKKFSIGYPADNILFEDTRRAVLYQGRNNRFEFDLTRPTDLRDCVRQFVTYAAPDIQAFYKAVDEFAVSLPDLAGGLKQVIDTEHAQNATFRTAFSEFHELCRTALNPQISADTIEEMLIQHLLTERLFRTIFDNTDFTRRNVIANEIEKVIAALTSRAFNRQGFLRQLDRYYLAIEAKGQGITEWSEKQGFLNRVYERFFQGYSVRQADTHGIVYTPQEIVGFMLRSVEHLLQTEFGTSFSTPGVTVLDPCTGTGNFLVNLMRDHINRRDLRQKYENDLFANEIMLLPYYIASLNIEHEYYALMGEYRQFEGLCFADTLDMSQKTSLDFFGAENSARVQKQKDTPITVILGNPPYNIGQQNENDNNKNRRYVPVDKRVAETYAKESKASLKIALGDVYIKFFRWATDRLNGQDGIVCFVSNNGFIDGIFGDGMRKTLLDEFTTIYHLDCGGNVRKNPKLSGTTHNVFGIQVGAGVTILVRRKQDNAPKRLFYYRQAEFAKASERLAELKQWANTNAVPWQELTPNNKNAWLTEGLQADFETFLPLGSKEAKASKGKANTLFRTYSLGVSTNRDNVVYDHNSQTLLIRIKQFIIDYNAEVDRWIRVGRPQNIDGFVSYDTVKWSHFLKNKLKRGQVAVLDEEKICRASYRPYVKINLYNDAVLLDATSLMPLIFPLPHNSSENEVICLTGVAPEKPFMLLAVNNIPDLHFTGAGTGAQCFPFYTYSEDGSNRQENITDWALEQFRAEHGEDVIKWEIFYYVYALLHDPFYRERYAENLKRELPRIPLSPLEQTPIIAENETATETPFRRYVRIGKALAHLHRDYETAPQYRLQSLENRDVPYSLRVEKMRLSKDKTQIVVNPFLTLGGIPPEVFEYRLGSRSALEWVIDQYQVSTDKRTGIVSDPNRPDDENYIVRLVEKVIHVSVETVRLVKELRPTFER